MFKKLQEDHSQVFDKLQEDNSIVFKKLQEDHALMLGKFQKDHLQLIEQIWSYQVKNEAKLGSIELEQREMKTMLKALMEGLLTETQIQDQASAYEDIVDSSPSDLEEAEPVFETDAPLDIADTPFVETNVSLVESRNLKTPSPTASASPTTSSFPTSSPSVLPTRLPSEAPSEAPSAPVPLLPVPDRRTLNDLVEEYFSSSWSGSHNSRVYG